LREIGSELGFSERGGGVARYVLKSVSDLNLQRGREKESALALAYFLSDFKC
jgi:hypothetical protein